MQTLHCAAQSLCPPERIAAEKGKEHEAMPGHLVALQWPILPLAHTWLTVMDTQAGWEAEKGGELNNSATVLIAGSMIGKCAMGYIAKMEAFELNISWIVSHLRSRRKS